MEGETRMLSRLRAKKSNKQKGKKMCDTKYRNFIRLSKFIGKEQPWKTKANIQNK